MLRFAAPPDDVDTRTLRLVDDGPPAVALGLTRSSAQVTVTAYAMGAGLPAFGGEPPIALDPRLIVWGDDGTSTYSGVTQSLLASSPGAWLLDTTGHAPVFEGVGIPGGGEVPSLTQSYFARAFAYGDATSPASACASAASSWATSQFPVAVACPPATVGRVGSPGGEAPCTETVGAGELSPDAFRCGGTSDDLALALSGLAPASAWVSRARSVVAAGAFGADAAIAVAGATAGDDTGPVYTCSAYGGACAGAGGGVSSSGVAPGGGSSSSSSGAGSSSSSGDPGTDPGVSTAGAVAGAALESSDGCGGSSDSSDGCGGSPDSSDESSSDDGSCSGSSSSSSSSSSDSCSGDSSSSNCAVWGVKPSGARGRSPTSRILVLMAVFAFLLRRRGRTSNA